MQFIASDTGKMDQARVEVLLFGRMADVAGQRRMTCTAQSLFGLLEQVFAEALAAGEVTREAIRMSVNQVQVFDDRPLADGDEVAFFSVFSGG